MKWTKEKRDALPKWQFGDPKDEEYPIADQDDVNSAAHLLGRSKHADPDKIKANVIKIAKKLKLDIPDSWKK